METNQLLQQVLLVQFAQKDELPPPDSEIDSAYQLIGMTSPTQESCLIGRRRVGLLRGAGELMDAEKTGRRGGFSSTPTGLWASGSEGSGGAEGQKING